MQKLETRERRLRSALADPLGRLALRCAQILLVLLLSAVLVWGLVQIQLVVIPAVIALILAAAVGPVVNWLIRHGVPPALATWTAFLAAIVLIAGLVAGITFFVRNQWDELALSFDEGIERLQELLRNGPVPISSEQIAAARESVIDFLTSRQFESGAIAGISMAVQLVTGAILMIVILFFLLKDGGRIWSFLLRPLQGEHLERGRRIGLTALGVLGGYLRGTATIALVDAVAIGVGLALIGVPLALPLAVVVFITAFIPIVGATLGGAVAAAVALFANGPVAAIIVVVLVFAVNQLEGNLLQPVVMGGAVSLHPLIIVVALTAGVALAGIIGAILAVPLCATAWAIVKVWNEPTDRALTGPAITGSSAAQ